MAWKPPAHDETISAPAAHAPGPSASWMPPEQDETITSPVGDLVSSVRTEDVPPPPLPEGVPAKVSAYLQRIMKAHNPFPTSMQDVKDMTAISPGKAGISRVLEEEGHRVGAAVRGSGKNMAEELVDPAQDDSHLPPPFPGIENPAIYALVNGTLRPKDQVSLDSKMAPVMGPVKAAAGATISGITDLLSDSLTPSSQAQNLGAEGIMSGLKGGEMALRGRIAEKVSGLPPEVAGAIRENPNFFDQTKGTPEALDAANKAVKDLVDEMRAGHIDKTTLARELSRAKEMGDVEAGVRSIQEAIKSARAKAGGAIGVEKEKLGFKTLEEQAQDIAKRGAEPKMNDEDLIRQTVKALDPSKTPDASEIEGLVKLRQAIDDRVNFGNKDINPPGTRMSAILKDLRAKINDRLGGPMGADVESFPMQEGVPREPTGAAGGEQPFGAPLRAAETEFSRVAKITDPLTKKFETVPKGVSTVIKDTKGGLRAIDPELAALNDLAGGKDALGLTENAVDTFNEGEAGFKKDVAKFDPLAKKFETTPQGMDTVRDVMRSGTEEVDPDMKSIKSTPKGQEALAKMKAEVNRFDADRVDVRPNGTAETVAQLIGITPRRAARLLAQSAQAGQFPSLGRVASILTQAAARGPDALSTTHFLLQQQDDNYRQTIQALQQGGDQ